MSQRSKVLHRLPDTVLVIDADVGRALFLFHCLQDGNGSRATVMPASLQGSRPELLDRNAYALQ